MRKTWLTAAEVAKICGVSERTVKNWAGKKTPNRFKRVKRGTRYFWPAAKLVTWLTECGKQDAAARVAGFVAAIPTPKKEKPGPIEKYVASQEQQSPPSPSAPENVATEAGLLDPPGGDGFDIFRARDVCARMLVQAVERFRVANGPMAQIESKNVREYIEQLRKLELACVELDERLERVIPVSQARRILGQACAKIRTDMQGIKYRVADDLAAASEPTAVVEILGPAIDDALRHLARALAEHGLEPGEGEPPP
ncbi:MAG: helix-turn-helix domain-containing protein [Kiritimatiellaeota bacterium]|nr:helix-turn-helix domain-containing protein [Kiritimatiellota bacterium]